MKEWRLAEIFFFLVFLNCIFLIGSVLDNSNVTLNGTKSQRLKPSVLGKCIRCKLMCNSLFEILKKSSPDESMKQIQFSNIWDKLCLNIKAGQDDCISFAEENSEKVFSWWNGHDLKIKDLINDRSTYLDQLCIDLLEVCCPEGHYGPQCLRCQGFPDNICSNNGKCAGIGTRLGNGHCICNKGYDGPNCDLCEKTYYMNKTMLKLNGTIKCLPCDPACAGTCFDGGPKGCHVCKTGFAWVIDSGCIDIDECLPELPSPCPTNSFCINTEGSYQCYQCDPACDGCEGDGPDSCVKCARDHVLRDGVCINPDPKPLMPIYASPARYLTYLGLCLVTCIIFRHNILVASAIGLAVAIYIMASEKSLETEYGRAFDKWWTKIFH